ncbi:hypothetical protein DDE82_006475 [Stemphylium lycopersici]|nr:hypothetical protein DDE82_006475 [Stemphylium lycopersici]
MEYSISPSQPWNAPTAHGFYPVNGLPSCSFELLRLEYEKEVLEDGLANCVTYLQALRKKQARNDRRLVTGPSPQRKKRKQIQQSKRDLEKEIKNRERDEQAFLNNLQACKANIYVAETASSPSTSVSSTVPDLTSNSTRCSYPDESEPTELGWNGWADETTLSPFQKKSSNPFFVDDMAPNDHADVGSVHLGTEEDVDPSRSEGQYVGNTETVPRRNDARTQFALSPEAEVFEPQAVYKGQEGELSQELAKLHISSSWAITQLERMALELMEKRRLTDAGIVQTRRQSSLERIVEEAGSQDWINATPQQRKLNMETEIGRSKRSRTNSL